MPQALPSTYQSVASLFATPLADLVDQAHRVHLQNHKEGEIQKCALLSIKTGGCSEDCAYCSQSSFYKTDIRRHQLLSLDAVKISIDEAKRSGATRFCMGAAWRSPKNEREFSQVLEMVRAVKAQGLEACVTLGMINPKQAQELKEAGLDVYNHNLDTSEDFYPKIISTHTYQDRLNTLRVAQEAKLNLCCGIILGLGESVEDRAALLCELAQFEPQPESVPINVLIPVAGTPLAQRPPVEFNDLLRTIAVARILMPKSFIKLSAGRAQLDNEQHLACFYAGANSLFVGERLLTKHNATAEQDLQWASQLANNPASEISCFPKS